jgi:hypothetical protein
MRREYALKHFRDWCRAKPQLSSGFFRKKIRLRDYRKVHTISENALIGCGKVVFGESTVFLLRYSESDDTSSLRLARCFGAFFRSLPANLFVASPAIAPQALQRFGLKPRES